MNTNLYKQKVINSILYFSHKVDHPTKVKMFKLLYFLDFTHFRETGRSVTNYKYYAWDYGPVPKELFNELDEIPREFENFFSLKKTQISDEIDKIEFIPKQKPNLKIFTPRELRIMDDLILVFKNVSPKQISEISHLKNKPWDKTKKEKGMYAEIDYLLSIEPDSPLSIEEAKFYLKDKEEFLNNYPMQ